MKYTGSKNRIAKYILPIILKDRKPNQYFVAPFCGGCNLLDKVDGLRIGADNNKYLIAMWQKVSKGWLPPQYISENLYNTIKNNKEHFNPELVGYVGFALSYGGKWFGGWCRDKEGKRNYDGEAYRNALKQFPKLKNVKFVHCDYKDLEIPKGSIIYCDPPYFNSTKYNSHFNHDEFWNWVRKQEQQTFISEYFECLWEKEIVSSLTKNTGSKKGVEKLWTKS